MERIFRRLTPDFPERPWNNTEPERSPFLFKNVHHGQRKLFWSEVEFLTLASKFYRMSDCVFVYVGAAPGHHISFLLKMFPGLKMLLFDPAPFVIKESRRVKIINDFFTDETVEQVKRMPFVQGKYILYVSDIRLSMDDDDPEQFERNAIRDMVQQMKWGIHMDATMIMLKNRFPYIEEDKHISLKWPIDDLIGKVHFPAGFPEAFSEEFLEKHMLYLDGDIYFQIVPARYSTETRLIARRPQGGKFTLKFYDIRKYESQCFHFNVVERWKCYKYKDSDVVTRYIAGVDNSYDCVAEFFLVCEYLKHFQGRKYNFLETFEWLYSIHDFLHNSTGRLLPLGYIRTFISDYVNKQTRSHILEDVQYFLQGDLTSIIEQYCEEVRRFLTQKQLILKNERGLLTPDEQEKQLTILDKSSETIYKWTKDIIRILDATYEMPEKVRIDLRIRK